MFKVHCLNNISEVGLSLFTDEYDKEATFEEADAILVRSAKMHELEMKENLLAVARAGAGVNNIPLDVCADKGIVVFNTPGANANAVKEQVIAGLLLGARDLLGGNKWVVENAKDEDIAKSAEKAKKAFAGKEIKGKKLGVIGLGAIGRIVANAAIDLGMEVYGYDPYLSINAAWDIKREVTKIDNIEEIYKNCDYITLHVPALKETTKMISKKEFQMMKQGVVIINFARDILVDEEELLNAIEERIVSKYVTDFANTTVVGKENIIIFPHLGASTQEAEENCALMAVKQVREYIENGNIINSVNYPACDLGECVSEGRIGICHKNTPALLSKITSIVGEEKVNITDMMNKSRGDFAYTLIDINKENAKALAKEIEKIDDVIKVRVIK